MKYMYLEVIRSRPTAYSKVTIQLSHSILPARGYNCITELQKNCHC